jgi:hypothetical protein
MRGKFDEFVSLTVFIKQHKYYNFTWNLRICHRFFRFAMSQAKLAAAIVAVNFE